ncbi:MAG: ABC transporter permease [Candidatus Omnitrophota bacterium]
MFKQILKYRDLLMMLTLRDIRIRYKQAVMGFLWAIFMPVLAIAAGLLIKTAVSIVSGKPLDLAGVVSISVKVLPWTFFISSIRFAVQSLVGNKNLVTKIYFPREVLPFSGILACLFDFSIAIIALIILLVSVKAGLSIYLLLIPVVLLFLILFTAGLSLLLSSANLFYRDVKYIVEIILMFGIFFTPVFYEASMFGKYETLLLLNPIGSILEAINSIVVLHKMPDVFWFSYAGLSSIITFALGMTLFRKAEPYFAENI